MAVSPDGNHVYVAAGFDDAVTVFSRNKRTGALTFVETIKDGVGGVDGLEFAGSVVVSPDGSRVYVAGTDDNALAVFQRDPTTGVLSFLGALKDGKGGVDGLDVVTAVTLSPGGRNVYTAASSDHAIAVFGVSE